jgi:hypothetical protein
MGFVVLRVRTGMSWHWLERVVIALIGSMLCAVALGQGVASPPPASADRQYGQEELDRLLAPVALYPDDLLAQILMASTYPVEVVEADRWARAHPGLSGDELDTELQDQDWDPSVKGLVAVPQVLAMMDERLDWTERLGDAFLTQQQDVMDTVQRLRARAEAAGTLVSTPQQRVVNANGVISIEPVNPEVVYVPVYDPAIIYGSWWWPAAPYYWYPPGYAAGGAGIYFGVGFVVGAAIWGNFNWGHRTVVINTRNYERFNRARISDAKWAHDPRHRRGVPYPSEATRRRYGTEPSGANARREYRGYEQPVSTSRPPPRPAPVQQAPEHHVTQAPAQPHGAKPAPVPRPQPAPAAPTAPAFESFGRGEAANAYSSRGAASRASEKAARNPHPTAGHAQGGRQGSAPPHPTGPQNGAPPAAPPHAGETHGGKTQSAPSHGGAPQQR